MNNKLSSADLRNYREGDFRINSFLEVFFENVQIGQVRIVESNDPEGDDEIVCFLPGGIGFQHYPVYDAASACAILFDKYYTSKNRSRKKKS